MSADERARLLELSQQLPDVIAARDWDAYVELCDETLTAFEPEAVGNLVAGMPFHKFYFEMESTGRPQQATISSPEVRLMGESACVTYVRLTQRIDAEGNPTTSACEETRIWQKQDGRWQHVHFHRSPSGFVQL